MNVSFIIPSWNEPIERLAATVEAALAATHVAEVIVVDDGSDVPVSGINADAIVIRQEHRGVAAAINSGLRLASCEWVGANGVGDACPADAFVDRDGLASFGSWQDMVSGEIHRTGDDWRERLWYDNQFSMGSTCIARDVLDVVGGWDESLTYSGDWNLALRIEAYCGWTRVDRVTFLSHLYLGGMTDRCNRSEELTRVRARDNAMVSRWARAHELAYRSRRSGA